MDRSTLSFPNILSTFILFVTLPSLVIGHALGTPEMQVDCPILILSTLRTTISAANLVEFTSGTSTNIKQPVRDYTCAFVRLQ